MIIVNKEPSNFQSKDLLDQLSARNWKHSASVCFEFPLKWEQIFQKSFSPCPVLQFSKYIQKGMFFTETTCFSDIWVLKIGHQISKFEKGGHSFKPTLPIFAGLNTCFVQTKHLASVSVMIFWSCHLCQLNQLFSISEATRLSSRVSQKNKSLNFGMPLTPLVFTG